MAEKSFMTVEEVAAELRVSKSKAYQIVRELNAELQKQGYLTVAGSVNATNWKVELKQTQKRGFATKREAQAWEHEAMLKQGAKLDMTFASFFEVYEADKKQRVKESTWESKSHVIRTKILPYFGNRKIAEIEATML